MTKGTASKDSSSNVNVKAHPGTGTERSGCGLKIEQIRKVFRFKATDFTIGLQEHQGQDRPRTTLLALVHSSSSSSFILKKSLSSTLS